MTEQQKKSCLSKEERELAECIYQKELDELQNKKCSDTTDQKSKNNFINKTRSTISAMIQRGNGEYEHFLSGILRSYRFFQQNPKYPANHISLLLKTLGVGGANGRIFSHFSVVKHTVFALNQDLWADILENSVFIQRAFFNKTANRSILVKIRGKDNRYHYYLMESCGSHKSVKLCSFGEITLEDIQNLIMPYAENTTFPGGSAGETITVADRLRQLFDESEEVNQTPLHYAIKQSSLDIVQFLLQQNSQLNAQYTVQTPPHVVCSDSSENDGQLILKQKQQQDEQNYFPRCENESSSQESENGQQQQEEEEEEDNQQQDNIQQQQQQQDDDDDQIDFSSPGSSDFDWSML